MHRLLKNPGYRQEIQAFTHTETSTEFLDKHALSHSDSQAKRGPPYGTGHPETAKKNTL